MARRRREKMGGIFSKGLIPYPPGGGGGWVAILRVMELYSLFLGLWSPMDYLHVKYRFDRAAEKFPIAFKNENDNFGLPPPCFRAV